MSVYGKTSNARTYMNDWIHSQSEQHIKRYQRFCLEEIVKNANAFQVSNLNPFSSRKYHLRWADIQFLEYQQTFLKEQLLASRHSSLLFVHSSLKKTIRHHLLETGCTRRVNTNKWRNLRLLICSSSLHISPPIISSRLLGSSSHPSPFHHESFSVPALGNRIALSCGEANDCPACE
jgi:hypothetical protein